MKKLKTIEQYLKEKKFNIKWSFWSKSGVKCPKCGKELMTPSIISPMFLKEQIVRCPSCQFEEILK